NEAFLNDNDIPLDANDPYLPQVFREAGYLTAQIGMLGWGNTTTRKQMQLHGWSYYYGYLDHFRSQGYSPPFLFENGELSRIEGNTRSDCGKGRTPENEQAYAERRNMEGKQAYAPDSMLKKTLEFIRYFKDTPFFVLFSTQLPHAPVSIPAIHPEVANNTALTPIEKEYASMVKLLDDHVGLIMAELRTLGIDNNTIIIFTSDNGHEISYQQQGRFEPPYSDVETGEKFDDSYFKYYGYKAGDVFNGNANLAGLKQSNLEGGIRVPLTFYSKGRLQSRVCDQIVSSYDFLPTMADMLNVKLTTSKNGVSYLPLLKKAGKLPKSRYIVVGSREGPALLMNDGWKLRYFYKKKKFELYNIREDEEEKYDLILRYPDKAKELETILLKECDGNLDRGTFL
ncbi:MAG: sulfatase-like hydrolase/transferase, partial [Tannerella sp.]|nr:sulfatase-like hydrolase/transferase [Tannerella sp.]